MTIKQVSSPSINQRAQNVIQVFGEDYTLEDGNQSVHFMNDEDNAGAALTATLPSNPNIGQRHRIIAVDVLVNVESGDTDAADILGLVAIPSGAAFVDYEFTDTRTCDSAASDVTGHWVASR